MKKRLDDLTKKEIMQTEQMLFAAAAGISSKKSAERFLTELLTESERVMLGRRIWIARMLLQGYTQQEIGETLEIGPNTIARVEKWLQNSMSGYRAVLKDAKRTYRKSEKQHSYPAPFTMRAMKKKYPLHFLLFPPYDV